MECGICKQHIQFEIDSPQLKVLSNQAFDRRSRNPSSGSSLDFQVQFSVFSSELEKGLCNLDFSMFDDNDNEKKIEDKGSISEEIKKDFEGNLRNCTYLLKFAELDAESFQKEKKINRICNLCSPLLIENFENFTTKEELDFLQYNASITLLEHSNVTDNLDQDIISLENEIKKLNSENEILEHELKQFRGNLDLILEISSKLNEKDKHQKRTISKIRESEIEDVWNNLERQIEATRFKNKLLCYRYSNAWEDLFRFDPNHIGYINGLHFGVNSSDSPFLELNAAFGEVTTLCLVLSQHCVKYNFQYASLPNGVESKIKLEENDQVFNLYLTRHNTIAQFNDAFSHFFKHHAELVGYVSSKSSILPPHEIIGANNIKIDKQIHAITLIPKNPAEWNKVAAAVLSNLQFVMNYFLCGTPK